MINLSHKSALIIGGMNGLSYAVASALAQAGAQVTFVHATDNAKRAATAAGAQRTAAADLSDQDLLVEQVAALAPVHIGVVCPSWFGDAFFLDTGVKDWDAALEQNFEQATYAAQALARAMIAGGNGGRIILLSSVASLMPFVRLSAFGTSLAALRALAKMAAVDLGPYGITVNVVAAGWTGLEETEPILTPEVRQHAEAGIPLGRIAEASEIANVCAFLASDLASYITGAVIPVDGGYTLTQSPGTSPFSAE